jgi:hypothetical protein
MRKPSQDFIDIQATIKQARVHLHALSKLVTGWKEFNQSASTHLASAAKWERDFKVQEDATPNRKRPA